MALTPEDIKNKQFTTTRGFGEGYVETEVDDFLDEIYEEFTRLVSSQGNGHPSAAPSVAPGPVAAAPVTTAPRDPAESEDPTGTTEGTAGSSGAPAQSPIEVATGILALAQRTAEDHLAAAREEAEQLRGDARREVEEIQRDAEQQRRTQLGSLQAEHSKLERTIESLRTFEREYRSRLRAYLDAQLHELDASQSPEPDGARRFLLDEGRNA